MSDKESDTLWRLMEAFSRGIDRGKLIDFFDESFSHDAGKDNQILHCICTMTQILLLNKDSPEVAGQTHSEPSFIIGQALSAAYRLGAGEVTRDELVDIRSCEPDTETA